MFIQTEETPNPEVLKFIPGKTVMLQGVLDIPYLAAAPNSPLAQLLFQIDGIKHLFFGNNFISITKQESYSWTVLKPLILIEMMNYYQNHEHALFEEHVSLNHNKNDDEDNNPLVREIKETIERYIQPAVREDGGHVEFDHFDEGIVYIKLQGACSACPSASLTLKAGIENTLMHYIPEVKMVQAL